MVAINSSSNFIGLLSLSLTLTLRLRFFLSTPQVHALLSPLSLQPLSSSLRTLSLRCPRLQTDTPVPSVISLQRCQVTNLFHANNNNNNDNDNDNKINQISIQNQLQTQTITRIATTSSLLAAISYATFPTLAMTLATTIHDAFDGKSTNYGYETLNLLLTDNSNQFVQNVHNFCALLFSLLTGHAFAFLYRQQENAYLALFEEVSAAQSLLEQLALVSQGRPRVYTNLLLCVRDYVQKDLRFFQSSLSPLSSSSSSSTTSSTTSTLLQPQQSNSDTNWPAHQISTQPSKDPLETLLYLTSVGEPSTIYDTILTLRRARSKRLAALQPKMPQINLYLLYVLGFNAWITFPVVAAGSQTVGGMALLDVDRVQLSIGVFAMSIVFGVLRELNLSSSSSSGGGDGIGGVYRVDYSVLECLILGLEGEIEKRLEALSRTRNDTGMDDDRAILSDGKEELHSSFKRGWIGRRLLGKIRKRRMSVH